ncbi:hypothetical protein PRVXH_002407 [Proteinivorax hydrogeniformans]|uniref:Phosphoglyceromutase n=1 Tax=Proteinivorax hydrogeniformans TaxID=1826727 RepID=A0AAU8HTG7_9FIRM
MKKKRLIAFLVFICITITSKVAYGEDLDPKTYIVVIDKVTPQQLLDYSGESLSYILENSSWGIMANNTAAGRGSVNNAASIGASSRAVAPSGELFFGSGEKLDDVPAHGLYSTFNPGLDYPIEGVVNPYINSVKHQNEELMHSIQIGALGDTLKEEGLTPMVIGNSDTSEFNRHVSWIAADSNGQIPFGVVDEEILTESNNFVGGKRTDYHKVIEYMEYYEQTADIYIIDTGDTYRIDAHYLNYTKETVSEVTRDSIQKMEYLFKYIIDNFKEGDNLLLITLNTPKWRQEEFKELIPTVYHYNREQGGGLLTSNSTKRPGVITNLDIAPTVLSFYDIEAKDMFGQTFTSVDSQNQQQTVLSMLKQINTVYSQRPFLVHFYVIAIIVLVIFALLNFKIKTISMSYLKIPLLALLWGPVAFLIMAMFPPVEIIPYLILYIAIVLLLAYITTSLFKNVINRLVFVGVGTVSIVVLDTLLNNVLQKQSVLGYDVIGGARFYGIGNEYTGVLLGATILATYPLYQKAKTTWLCLVYGGVLIMMMAPFWGTNFGGTLALSVCFLMVLINNKSNKSLIKTLVALGLLMIAIMSVLIGVNIMTESQTHIGNLFGGDNTLEDIVMTATRKLSMNLTLIRYSIWSRVFFVLLLAIIFLGFYPPKSMSSHKDKTYYLAIRAILAGSFAALILNDSGIVAAAISMVYLSLPILYWFCCDNSSSNSSH